MKRTEVNTKPYIVVFAALAALTVITVAISYFRLPIGPAIFLAMAIATLKGSLVAAYFMHLVSERGIIFTILGVTLLFFIFLMIIPLTDLAHRVS